MNIDVNVVVLIGQLVLATVLAFIAWKKAPRERTVMDATTANQYAQAAKTKGEENAQLVVHVASLESRLEAVENKRYKISIEFITGDPPEVLKAEVAQILLPIMPKLQKVKMNK